MLRKHLWTIGIYLLLGGVISSITGCNYIKSVDIFQELSEEQEIYTFYGEGRQKSYFNNKLVQDIHFKEWKGTGKKYHSESNIETDKAFYKDFYREAPPEELIEGNIVKMDEKDTYNENKLIVHEPYKNHYSIKDISLVDDVNPSVLLGINGVLNAGGLKDYATSVVTSLAKEYNLTIEDNVKINGRQTQHIKAVSKKLGENEIYEIWIDQNTWLIVKQRIKQGNFWTEFEYINFSLNPIIDENIFKVEIPDNAKVEYLDNNLEKINEEVTLEEAIVRLGIPIFYLEENQDISLTSARYIETISSVCGTINLTYRTKEGKEVIVENSPSSAFYEKLDRGYESFILQGKKAIYYEVESMKVVEFINKGVICDIYVKNSEMSKQELIDIANRLILKEE